jgi:hypothetical protein
MPETTVSNAQVFPQNQPTVADEMAFAELPEDVKAMVKRLYGSFDIGAGTLEAAYKAGFNDGAESCEVERPYYSRSYFENFVGSAKAVTP